MISFPDPSLAPVKVVREPQSQKRPDGAAAQSPSQDHFELTELPPVRLAAYQLSWAGWAARTVQLSATIVQAGAMIAPLCYFARKPAPPAPTAPEMQIPRQQNYRARLDRVTYKPGTAPETQGYVARSLRPHTQADHLRETPFRLIFGAGFMAMYQHLGHLRALVQLGLIPADMAGASSGAIVAAMWGCLTLQQVEEALMTLSLTDFLDLSVRTLVYEGALCPGAAFERKLKATFAMSERGVTRIEECRPKLSISVFEQGRTQLRTEGDLVESVRLSAGLPLLFACREGIDGGWIEQHGGNAQRPGERSLTLRVEVGDVSKFEAALGRPAPNHNVSADPEHLTLHVALKRQVTIGNFLTTIDFDKPLLKDVIDQTYAGTMAFLASPGGPQPNAEPVF